MIVSCPKRVLTVAQAGNQTRNATLGNKLLGIFAEPIDRILSLRKLDDLYRNIAGNDDPVVFLDKLLAMLGVNYNVSAGELDSIPPDGPVIIVANHPYGGIEGLILARMLLSRRADTKIVANNVLNLITELKSILFLVNVFDRDKVAIQENTTCLRKSVEHLKNGGLLGVFPSGEVAHWDMKGMKISESGWTPNISRIVKLTGATVVPVHFDGANGLLFNMAGLIHPALRTAMLPREFANKSKKSIHVTIGSPISASRINSIKSHKKAADYLRMRTMILNYRNSKIKEPCQRSLAKREKDADIIAPVCADALLREVEGISSDRIILRSGEYFVAYTYAEESPLIMQEISRLREITFRLAGEGTGLSCDIDSYDKYYTQLFVWNTKRNEIVGAYRLAKTCEVIKQHGKKGLYTTTLFNLTDDFFERIGPALELGRSFIRSEYQKSYAPLLLLWRGIGMYVSLFPKYKTLFGAVSISNDYKYFSRQLMASYFEISNPKKDLADNVIPNNPLICDKKIQHIVREMNSLEADITDLIGEIESGKGIPVLIRQYMKLGGSILKFNVDPEFSYTLDGLIVVDLLKTDFKQLERYIGADGAAKLFDYHCNKELSVV